MDNIQCFVQISFIDRYGQCGVGHKKEVTEATLVPVIFEGVRSLKAGHYHSALVNIHGQVFTWGWGVYGQLGHGGLNRTDDILLPKLVKTIKLVLIAWPKLL